MTTREYELHERIEAVSNASGDEDAILTIAIPPEKPVGEVLQLVENVRTYEERTEEEGGEFVVVHSDTDEGARFDETFGVGAILRFETD